MIPASLGHPGNRFGKTEPTQKCKESTQNPGGHNPIEIWKVLRKHRRFAEYSRTDYTSRHHAGGGDQSQNPGKPFNAHETQIPRVFEQQTQ
jgi:hypothetical protein